jgi:predicted RNA-binding Zn-ribbon protein involved in translation (DUF1610 family)
LPAQPIFDIQGGMLDGLKKGMLKLWANQIKEFTCPKCGAKFAPFKDGPPQSFDTQIVCPSCGFSAPMQKAVQLQAETKVNPPGPFEKPEQTKIERKPVSETEVVFYIPASGRWGGMLFFAIFWNAISWTVFLAFLLGGKSSHAPLTALVVTSLFPLIGIGMAYAAVRSRFAVHLLYLGPDRIRLQRQLFGHSKNFDLVTSRVTTVRKAEFYQRNYQPVYGVELKSPDGKIRFGSILTDDEKNWLCWEIREFVKGYAQSLV